MAEAISTPRVNSSYLDNFTNQTVRLIGKVSRLQGESAVLDAEGNVTVHLNRDSHLTVGNATEIVGKVQPDLSIKVLSATDLGPASELNFAAINAVVEATHRHKEIFYGAGPNDM